jgi:5'-nucleotidase (lipoprotein e(P4) family)
MRSKPTMMRSLSRTTCLLLASAALACAPAAGTVATTPRTSSPAMGATASADTIPASVRWFRASAERRALSLQTYRLAAAALERRAAGLAAGTWGVILDADETVIDNSPYQQELARRRATFDAATWNEWVMRGAAAALPGAAEFTRRVRERGGRVVIVTNREQAQCDATRANLERASIAIDAVLCKTESNSFKDARFDAVANGTPPSTLPPLRVVMWVGDNIQDFPRLRQDLRTLSDSAYAEFGDRFIVLPNPMYGSWERNPLP